MTRHVIIAVLLLMAACKQKRDTGAGLPISPLVGLCQPLVIKVTGIIASQRCAWQGYWWTCDTAACVRNERVSSERMP